jgi:hypothetical protein
VKPTLRLLLVCFLMLALPFQAFASASMRPPVVDVAASVAASAPQAPAVQLPPCHRQMAMAATASMGHRDAKHEGHAGQHTKSKCGACCVGAAMAPGLPAALALAPASTISIPFRAGHLPSVDPVLPERPPSTLLA